MNAILPVLIVVAVLVIIIFVVLAMVVVGIHAGERRMNLTHAPQTRLEIFARRVLGAHSDQQKKIDTRYAEIRR